MPSVSDQPKGSPAKALQKVISEQRSGRLSIQDPVDPSIGWRAYFGAGQIHFAESTMGQQERLPYLLQKYLPNLEITTEGIQDGSDYPYLCQCWKQYQLPLNHFRKLLATFTQEALIHFLAIPQSTISFESTIGLDPLLLSAPFRQIILPVREQIGQWAQIRLELCSPFQRLKVQDQEQLLRFVWQESTDEQSFESIGHHLETEPSVYELATTLNLDIHELTLKLHPMIKAGVIGTHPFQIIKETTKPLIACIDDSQTIQQFVKLSLESSGYEVLSLLDPTQAIPNILEHCPLLILMDIEMPKLDGYELCRMVRQVDELRDIPVVMLTGREGIIDRVRARMSGCTAYLTKPFNPQELLAQVQKLTAVVV